MKFIRIKFTEGLRNRLSETWNSTFILIQYSLIRVLDYIKLNIITQGLS